MTHKERKEEVREILALDTDELVKRAKGQLVLFPTLDEVYDYLAEEMVKEFAKAAKGRKIQRPAKQLCGLQTPRRRRCLEGISLHPRLQNHRGERQDIQLLSALQALLRYGHKGNVPSDRRDHTGSPGAGDRHRYPGNESPVQMKGEKHGCSRNAPCNPRQRQRYHSPRRV